jgi:membrane protein DedA with SNARE-associated domain
MDSMHHIDYLVRSYGYWALFVGVFFEGETVLLIGGLLSRLGLLKLPVVIAVAFIGSFSGDQLYFYIGYFKGQAVLSKHHTWKKRVDRVHEAIKRYHNLIMLGFRFIYGMRIMTPFVLGLDKEVKAIRFSLLNAAGAVIWSGTIAAGGYFFGYALEGFIKDVKQYEIYAISAIAIIGIGLWIIHRLRNNKLSQEDMR